MKKNFRKKYSKKKYSKNKFQKRTLKNFRKVSRKNNKRQKESLKKTKKLRRMKGGMFFVSGKSIKLGPKNHSPTTTRRKETRNTYAEMDREKAIKFREMIQTKRKEKEKKEREEREKLIKQLIEEEEALYPIIILLDDVNLEINTTSSLGQGQFGEVSIVTYEGKKCAYKVSRQDGDPQLFIEEAVIMHPLKHCNIVSLIGIVSEDKSLRNTKGLLLEMCQLGDLRTFIRENEPHTVEKFNLFTCFNDIIDGMIYIHSRKIIHCDLAARNILISGETSGETIYVCKIGDFGLSSEDSELGVSKSEFPARWYSPECALGDEITKSLDVWSFGCIIIEILNVGKYLPHIGLETCELVQFYDDLISTTMNILEKKKLLISVNHFCKTKDKELLINVLLNFLFSYIFIEYRERKSFKFLKTQINENLQDMLRNYRVYLGVPTTTVPTLPEEEIAVNNNLFQRQNVPSNNSSGMKYDGNYVSMAEIKELPFIYSEPSTYVYRTVLEEKKKVFIEPKLYPQPSAGALNETSKEKPFTVEGLDGPGPPKVTIVP